MKTKQINKEAFQTVIKLIQRNDKQFIYRYWFRDLTGKHKTIGDVVEHPCGTAGCVGGWAAILEYAKTKSGLRRSCDALSSDQAYQNAMKFLGIESSADANFLFSGYWHFDGTAASTKDVIAKLKNIIETGLIVNPDFDKRYLERS